LKEENRLAIPGLGVFSVKDRKARKGRNPKTGAEIDIEAKKAISFRAAKSLKDEIK
jgi:DNA-binding protein HU-beta